MEDVTLMMGDCLERMGEIESASVDAIICDPPYPEISRPYGRMTEADWHVMMRGVVSESRRILKPSGSAVFILQPNSEKVGRMRPWLFEFQAWTAREWNMVQDAWWWNNTVLPTGGATCRGLLRGSLKACVWLGSEDCHRDQGAVLATPSDETKRRQKSARSMAYKKDYPSGQSMDHGRAYAASISRGGVIPFNVLAQRNVTAKDSADAGGHPAMTPEPVADWWVRYVSPEGGTVCDPFMGSGTVGLAALKRGRKFIGIERDPVYFATAERRIAEHRASMPLLAGGAA